jgi:hypothetical protein
MNPSNPCDTQNFEKAFLDMKPVISDEIDAYEVQEQERIDTEFADSEGLIEISSPRVSHLPEGTVGDSEGYTSNNQHPIVIHAAKAVLGADNQDGESGRGIASKMPVDLEGDFAKQTIIKTRFVDLRQSPHLTQRTLEPSECEPHPSTPVLNSFLLPMLPCL